MLCEKLYADIEILEDYAENEPSSSSLANNRKYLFFKKSSHSTLFRDSVIPKYSPIYFFNLFQMVTFILRTDSYKKRFIIKPYPFKSLQYPLLRTTTCTYILEWIKACRQFSTFVCEITLNQQGYPAGSASFHFLASNGSLGYISFI